MLGGSRMEGWLVNPALGAASHLKCSRDAPPLNPSPFHIWRLHPSHNPQSRTPRCADLSFASPKPAPVTALRPSSSTPSCSVTPAQSGPEPTMTRVAVYSGALVGFVAGTSSSLPSTPIIAITPRPPRPPRTPRPDRIHTMTSRGLSPATARTPRGAGWHAKTTRRSENL